MRERTKQFCFRLYKSELDKIKSKAKQCGVSASDYVRSCALERPIFERPAEEFGEVYRLIGNLRLELEGYNNTEKFTAKLKTAQDLLLNLYHGKEVKEDGGNKDLAD